MLKSLVAVTVLILMFVSPLGAMFVRDSEFIEELSLLKMADHGFIVFVGTVMHKEYVTRPVIGITPEYLVSVPNPIAGLNLET